MKYLALVLIKIYRLFISPLLGTSCRYFPTCSEYATEAIKTHGALRGSLLTAKRLFKCHPFGGCGCDPVPPLKSGE